MLSIQHYPKTKPRQSCRNPVAETTPEVIVDTFRTIQLGTTSSSPPACGSNTSSTNGATAKSEQNQSLWHRGDDVKLNHHRFISPAASATSMATLNLLSLHSPRKFEVPSPSLASIVTRAADDEESSCDASVERSRTTQSSLDDEGHGNNRSHQEGEQSATADTMPALIQQFSVRGLEMAPFPLKLNAIFVNPRGKSLMLSFLKDSLYLDIFLIPNTPVSCDK